MRLHFLGTGTSQGVPVIGCTCAVCTSEDTRNHRMRSSVWIELGGKHIVIDTPAEFRLQALRAKLPRLDALLYTHAHADHIFGIDDIRRYNQMQREVIPLYASKETLEALRQIAGYIFDFDDHNWALPKAEPHEITGPFELFGRVVEPLLVWHGKMPVTAFRIGRMAYVTDCNAIPAETMERLEGLDLLVLDALRHRPHPTHFSISEAVEVIQRLKPKRALLTHLCHEVDHATTEAELPPGIRLAYDGLVEEIDDP